MAQALRQAIQTFEMDDTVTVGVLHGIGGTFSSGYDMKEFFDNSVKPASLFRTVSTTIACCSGRKVNIFFFWFHLWCLAEFDGTNVYEANGVRH